jgi:hypothetical protein
LGSVLIGCDEGRAVLKWADYTARELN